MPFSNLFMGWPSYLWHLRHSPHCKYSAQSWWCLWSLWYGTRRPWSPAGSKATNWNPWLHYSLHSVCLHDAKLLRVFDIQHSILFISHFFHSCICHPMQFCTVVSSLAFSTPVQICAIFSSPAFLCLAFSVLFELVMMPLMPVIHTNNSVDNGDG